MAEDKKGFILYADQKEIFDQLTNEKAGELIKHVFSYVNDDNPTSNDALITMAFTPIKLQLKRDLKKFEATKKQRSEAGKRSAEVRKAQRKVTALNGVERTPTNPTVIVNDNVNVTVKDNVILNKSEIETLKEKYTDIGYEWMIDKLANYKLASGKEYKSDYGAINSWVVKEWKKTQPQSNGNRRVML